MHFTFFRWSGITAFAIAFLMFFMTFCYITCNGRVTNSRTGVKLFFDKYKKENVRSDSPRHPEGAQLALATYGPQVTTGIAFICGLWGLLSCIISRKRRAVKIQKWLGITGFVMLLCLFIILKYFFSGEIPTREDKPVQVGVRFTIYYYFSVAGFAIAAGIALMRLRSVGETIRAA